MILIFGLLALAGFWGLALLVRPPGELWSTATSNPMRLGLVLFWTGLVWAFLIH